MSSFITVVVNTQDSKELVEKLLKIADNQCIGIFFENRYKENFEKNFQDSLCFNIADTKDFCNCENLVDAWWVHGIEDYFKRMRIIESILKLCLDYVNTIDFWMGTSGDQIDDFIYQEIEIKDFVSSIHKLYEEEYKKYYFIPPSIHFKINKNKLK